jgi:hypothetical protein
MSNEHTTKRYADDKILTGKLWRKHHPYFNDLPFYSDITRTEELAESLEKGLSQEGCYKSLMVVRLLVIYSPK